MSQRGARSRPQHENKGDESLFQCTLREKKSKGTSGYSGRGCVVIIVERESRR